MTYATAVCHDVKSLDHLFFACCQDFKDRPAVIFDDGRNNRSEISYGELCDMSKKITDVLQTHVTVTHGNIIGLLIPTVDHRTPAAILGILSVGAAFIYCETGYYVETAVKRLAVQWFLVDKKYSSKFFEDSDYQYSVHAEIYDIILVQVQHHSPPPCCPDTAYVIMTSGTTGKPKLVHVPHTCIIPNILHLRDLFSISSDDLLFWTSPLTFDPSVVELFVTLSRGACLLIIPSHIKGMPQHLADMLCSKHHVTVLMATPTLMYRFGSELLKNSLMSSTSTLRLLVLGGEACPPTKVLKDWCSQHALDIYNLYGITEVSCWASYHQVTQQELLSDTAIPLGKPLLETELEVRNDNGVVTSGRGELYVGGIDRICFIDGVHEKQNTRVMRSTGDLVCMDDKDRILYEGRTDNQIKRHGQRLTLISIEQYLVGTGLVEAASAIWNNNHLDLVVTGASEECVEYLIKQNFPRHYWPDGILCLQNVPMTKHGKVDRATIKATVLQSKKPGMSDPNICLSTVWMQVLKSNDVPTEDCMFLESGGDSFMAVQLNDQIQQKLNCDMPNLIDYILNSNYKKIQEYIREVINTNLEKTKPVTQENNVTGENSKLTTDDVVKKPRYSEERDYQVVSIRRTGLVAYHGAENDGYCCCQQSYNDVVSGTGRDLIERWKYDTGKCVDASPLVVQCRCGNSCVYIGSHSYTFCAIMLSTGEVIWETRLGDRVESSACLSYCGQLVVVGCYDGCVYFLDRSSGAIFWQFHTDGVVKSSPVCDMVSGIIYIGSHDQKLYALNAQRKMCFKVVNLCAGSIFASPSLCYNPYQLYVASLNGTVSAFKPADLSIVWKYKFDKPLFSTPCVSKNGLCIGCVDSWIYHLDHKGNLLWQVCTDGPVFSSACIMDSHHMVIGSHNSAVFCVSNGQIIWKFKCDSPVYSSPVLSCSDKPAKKIICICSTQGTVYLLTDKGILLSQVTLPGQVFSSPVVVDNYVIVGCRDDFVYCLSLSKHEAVDTHF